MTLLRLPPTDPYIYHITHIANLPGIVKSKGLWCDAQRVAQQFASVNIGHNHIKQRRLNTPVKAPVGGMVGDYVPFNFCPRSVMLYVVSRGHPDYSGGQADVIHLVSKVSSAVGMGKAWAFTDRHAELAHSLHYCDLAYLDQVPWETMDTKYWSDVREERQAEFLVRDSFPWSGICSIGVMNEVTKSKVDTVLSSVANRPPVQVQPSWYY